MPYNYSTDNGYSGINILLLWEAATERGFGTNAWMTMKQANELGGCVRKGEQSTEIIYYNMREVTDTDDSGTPDEESTRIVPFVRSYRVFNLQQIEGIDIEMPEDAPSPEAGEEGVPEWDGFLEASGARIETGGTRAYYNRTRDHIRLPDRWRFPNMEDWYATAAHELTHWTGHETRLKRVFGKRFGDDAYAVEELVAELGSTFLCTDLGIKGELQNHASYLDHWLKVLKADKYALFKASTEATKAHRFIIEKMEKSTEDQVEDALSV